MKTFILLLLPALIFSSCTLPQKSNRLERNVPVKARNSNEPMKRVFVLPFVDAKNEKSKVIMDAARRSFVTDLLRTGEFIVLKNTDFPGDLEAMKESVEQSHQFDMAKAALAAQGTGVNGIVEGQVIAVRTKKVGDDVGIVRKIKAIVEATVRVRAYAVDGKKEIYNQVKTATVEASTTRFAEKGYSNLDLEEDPALVNEAAQVAFEGLIPGLMASMRKLSWSGRIAVVRGEKIYINAGRVSGVQVGDLLKVLDQGNDIFDPQTGNFIGRAEGRMKGTIEIVSYFGQDGAIGVVHSGADFRENDRVEMY